MFVLPVAALPEKNLSQVMDIIKNIPAINPFEVLKLRLLEAHVLSDQEKMDALFQLGPLGDRKPSQLLASMLSVCPSGMELQRVFQYLFLQRLSPDSEDASRRTGVQRHPCPGGDGGQALGVPHTPAPQGDGGTEASRRWRWRAADSHSPAKKKHPKKKTGGSPGPSGNGGVLSYAEQARVGSGLCFKHFCYRAIKPTAAPSPATGRETRDPRLA
jgi:hypothetical protein